MDIVWPDGAAGGLVLTGCGRDFVTGSTPADSRVAARTGVTIQVETPSMRIVSADVPSADSVAEWLSGKVAHFRMRRELDREHPEFVSSGSLAALLVDEVPPAVLISGAALVRNGLVRRSQEDSGMSIGVCAGWIENGSMHVGLATRPFIGEGPPAPSLRRIDDPDAWHEEPELPFGAIRRRRRIDVAGSPGADQRVSVDVFFRDSFMEQPGMETVIHEYGLELTVDPVSRCVVTIVATAHVLPGPECPSAAASAQRIAGMAVTDIRAEVRDRFRGASTCTHLNDALRSLGDLRALLSW
ncbi:MAG: hypothetical protein JWL72_3255 [Ilumatobacteraceae bacterium]|nr:hypothetical protein [Ilumatobacteraceae bacterium]MCU1389917.1 hypothetical protein [Ilumatobacteraceae bacterium]